MVTPRIHWRAALALLGIVVAISALMRLVQVRETRGQAPSPHPTASLALLSTRTPPPTGTVALVRRFATSVPSATPTMTPRPSPTRTLRPTHPPQPTSLPPVPRTHVEAVVGQPQYINPILAQRDVDLDLTALIFSGLTKVNAQAEIVTDLAREWDISPDGRTYAFELRRGVEWHDGTRFTADDVVFTVRAMQDQDYQGPAHLAALWQTVTAERVDRYSVRFILSEPFTPFLDYTTIGILPAHLLADVPATLLPQQPYNLMPIGTGPFQPSGIHLDRGYLVLEANPAYYGPPPRMKQVEFQFYGDRATIMVGYDQRAVTGIGGLLPQELVSVRERPSLALHSAPLSREAFIFLNLRHPAASFLSEREVRQALLLALDRQALIDQELAGQGIVAHNVVLPHTWAHHLDSPHYAYDPEGAQTLLDQVGWLHPGNARNLSMAADSQTRQRQDVKLQFSLLVDGGNATHARLADEIAHQWAEIGVQVHVDPGLSQDRLQAGLYTAALVEWEVPPDPDPYPIWHSTQADGQGQNYTGFQNRDADELMEQGRQITAPEERRQIYHRFQDIWAHELPALPLYHPVYNYAVDRRIEEVHLGLMLRPSDRFRNIGQWNLTISGEG
jgi:peptide/nickel transport system substrate-binding protein